MNQPLPGAAVRPFSSFDLPRPVLSALASRQLDTPTPIQDAVIPDALAGHDVLGKARTGSGKTLAFGLPVLVRLSGGQRRRKAPRGLILLPTRELATQVRDALVPFADRLNLSMALVYGGTPINRQISAVTAGVDLVIATPGRLGDLLERRALTLDAIEVIALDEADHLCDLGFYKPIDAILAKTPQGAQKLLLSATLDGDVDRLVRRHLPVHRRHEVDSAEDAPADMTHHLVVTRREDRVRVARDLIAGEDRSIVFTRTKHGARRLAKQLSTAGLTAVDLHGDLNQNQRERNLARFRNGTADVIVATDVAARGIHVDGIGLVVHYDPPAEHKAFTHRSGRTARAGESGIVVTLATPEDLRDVVAMQNKAGVSARRHEVEGRTLTLAGLATGGTLTKLAPAAGGAQRSNG